MKIAVEVMLNALPKNLFLINLCAKMFTLDLLEKGPINGLVHL